MFEWEGWGWARYGFSVTIVWKSVCWILFIYFVRFLLDQQCLNISETHNPPWTKQSTFSYYFNHLLPTSLSSVDQPLKADATDWSQYVLLLSSVIKPWNVHSNVTYRHFSCCFVYGHWWTMGPLPRGGRFQWFSQVCMHIFCFLSHVSSCHPQAPPKSSLQVLGDGAPDLLKSGQIDSFSWGNDA